MKTQKQIKTLKKSISINTAINIGYYSSVVHKLPIYSIINSMRYISNYITENLSDAEIENIIVTEAVKQMNYQDFKDIQKYFFE